MSRPLARTTRAGSTVRLVDSCSNGRRWASGDCCESTAPGRRAVLDVGGGHAQLTPLLLEWGCAVWVQGSATGCSERIQPLMANSEGRLHFVASSLWSLPFPDGYFDLVVGIRLLAHVERWRELLSEMARVSGHRLMIDYPPMIGINALEPMLFTLKRRLEGNTRPYFNYMKGDLISALRCSGFERFSVDKQFFVPNGDSPGAPEPEVVEHDGDNMPDVRLDRAVGWSSAPFGGTCHQTPAEFSRHGASRTRRQRTADVIMRRRRPAHPARRSATLLHRGRGRRSTSCRCAAR